MKTKWLENNVRTVELWRNTNNKHYFSFISETVSVYGFCFHFGDSEQNNKRIEILNPLHIWESTLNKNITLNACLQPSCWANKRHCHAYTPRSRLFLFVSQCQRSFHIRLLKRYKSQFILVIPLKMIQKHTLGYLSISTSIRATNIPVNTQIYKRCFGRMMAVFVPYSHLFSAPFTWWQDVLYSRWTNNTPQQPFECKKKIHRLFIVVKIIANEKQSQKYGQLLG